MSKGVRIPNPTSLEKAVSLYYTKLALRSEDILNLFVKANSELKRDKDGKTLI